MNMTSKISIASSIIAISILISRSLGIFREILIANIAGSGLQRTAYELAFTLPDMLNHFVSTGFLSLTFIPLFTQLKSNNDQSAHDFFCNILNSFVVIILGISILLWIFMEPFLSWFIPNNLHAQLLPLAVSYSRIILPAQIFFFTGAIFTAVQHYHLQFLIPCLLGLTYNVFIIVGGLITQTIEGFVWGVLIGSFVGGGVLQGWAVFKSLRIPYSFYFNPFQKNFKQYLTLSFPLILGIGPLFSLELLYRYYGSFLGEHGVSYLSYAYRMMIVCVSITAFATGIASYPYITKLLQQQKLKQLQQHLIQTLFNVYGNLIPLTIIIWIHSPFIIKILLERGLFTSEDTQIVANLLRYFIFSAFGLASYVILIRYFYGCKKMWTPTLVSIIMTLLFLPLYHLSIQKYGLIGIPIISTVNVSCLFILLLIIWYILCSSKMWINLLINSFKVLSLSTFLFGITFLFHHYFITIKIFSVLSIIIILFEALFIYFFYAICCKILNLPHILIPKNT